MMPEKFKRCGRCKEHKPLTEFYPSRTRGGLQRGAKGVMSLCKSCDAERQRHARASRKARQRAQGVSRDPGKNRAHPRHPDAIECRECGPPFLFNTLQTHLHRIHGYGKREYQRRYPGAPVISETMRAMFREHARDRAYDKEPRRSYRNRKTGELEELRVYWTPSRVIQSLRAANAQL